MGKGIGGALGMPFEGSEERPGIRFYSPAPGGAVANDDLDLQLIWLEALERFGSGLSLPEMARCYRAALDVHWDEYGVALRNLGAGLEPPQSGAFDNWFSEGLGAAIRSEIWASVFAGAPEVAGGWAALDASIDHSGEGVWAEVFLAAVESALLGGVGLEEALERGKEALPGSSRLREMFVCLDAKWRACGEFEPLYELVSRDYGSVNFTDAVMNGGFVYSALLAGKGDFERTLLLAVNCGRDTDCNAATAGAIMGALRGADGIPRRWREVVEDRIVTGDYLKLQGVPATMGELSERVLALSERLRGVKAPPAMPPCTVPVEGIGRRECRVNGCRKTFAGMRLPLSEMPELVGKPVQAIVTLTLREAVDAANLMIATRGLFEARVDGRLAAVKGDLGRPVPAPHRLRGGRLVALPVLERNHFQVEVVIAPTYPVPDLFLGVFDWNNRHLAAEWTVEPA